MNLYIETENGATKNHPAFENNLMQAFGLIPIHWEPFIRIDRPVSTIYQTFDSPEPVYAQVNGNWVDVWSLRDMTAEEVASKQQAVKDAWITDNGFSSWVFNSAVCVFEPPIIYPQDNKPYRWDEPTTSWVELS